MRREKRFIKMGSPEGLAKSMIDFGTVVSVFGVVQIRRIRASG